MATAASCSTVGTYNPILGRCTCPIGYAGPSCENFVLPACRRYASSSTVSCAVRRPQHCDCLRQCRDAGAFEPHFFPYCFETPGEAVGLALGRAGAQPPNKLSEVPTLPRSSSFVFREWPSLRPVTADLALTVEFMAHMRHVPHGYCQNNCSDRGACIATQRVAQSLRGSRTDFSCRCDAFRLGPGCEISTTPYCWNDCGGRGKCVDGYCVCKPPNFGPGCAYSPSMITSSSGSSSSSAARGFKVHVYDLDPIVLRRHNYGSDPDPIFNTYHIFLSALLSDPASLTPDPDDADLLLAPAFGTNMEKLLEYYEHAQEHLQKRFKSWDKHSGEDHFWLISGDGGGCDLPRLRALRKSMMVAHYLKLNYSTGNRDALISGGKHCGVPNRDIALPPHVPHVERKGFLARGEQAVANRRLTFFFAGNVPDRHLVATTPDEQLYNEAYSEGVRQLIWKYHHNKRGPTYRIVERSESYKSDWSDSKFCLAPLGVGWGVRLTWALGGGCIPILASSQVSAWFDDAIDYSSFSIRGYPKESLKDLHTMLAAIPTEQLQRMHENVVKHRRLFLWGSSIGGFAYNVTMHELCWRARYRKAGVDCASLLPADAKDLVLPPQQRRKDAAGGATRAWWRRARGAS